VTLRWPHGTAKRAAETLASALAAAGSERSYSAELHRLKGELLAQTSGGCNNEAKKLFPVEAELAKRQVVAALDNRAQAKLRRWLAYWRSFRFSDCRQPATAQQPGYLTA